MQPGDGDEDDEDGDDMMDNPGMSTEDEVSSFPLSMRGCVACLYNRHLLVQLKCITSQNMFLLIRLMLFMENNVCCNK